MRSPIWLFDLDNTLHNAEAGIFQLINQAMTHYLADRLQLPLETASHLREDYWHRYGATLAGLQIHHPEINIHEFLCASHPMPEILEKLTPIQGTKPLLGRLKGRKAIFSNGPTFYVEALANALDIHRDFELLAGTDRFGLLYKPNRQAYLTVCQLLETTTQNCIMVDDNADNLYAAKALGMTTVWFGAQTHALPFIDCSVKDMSELATWAAKQNWLAV